MTQLHISQLGLLSVCSAPLSGGTRRGQEALGRRGTEEEEAQEERRKGRGRETEGDRYGKPVAAARHSSLKHIPVGISDVVLTRKWFGSDMSASAERDELIQAGQEGGSEPVHCTPPPPKQPPCFLPPLPHSPRLRRLC